MPWKDGIALPQPTSQEEWEEDIKNYAEWLPCCCIVSFIIVLVGSIMSCF